MMVMRVSAVLLLLVAIHWAQCEEDVPCVIPEGSEEGEQVGNCEEGHCCARTHSDDTGGFCRPYGAAGDECPRNAVKVPYMCSCQAGLACNPLPNEFSWDPAGDDDFGMCDP